MSLVKIKNVPLGFKYKGYDVTPSDRLYYGEYLYKVYFSGNTVFRDIKEHAKLDKILHQGFWWQSTYTNKNRVVYLRDIGVLNNILDEFPNLIQKVFGPVDEAHFEHISHPYQDTEFNFVYKDKLWYNKYDIKIDFISARIPSWQRNINSGTSLEKSANEFMEFIKEQDFSYHMYLNTEAKYWHQNYLYCTSKDLKEIQPWISMLYNEVIEKINSAVIYSVDK